MTNERAPEQRDSDRLYERYVRPLEKLRQPLASNQQQIQLEALVDTGFDGGVVIPRDLLDPSLAPVRHLPWSLADDSQVLLPAFSGEIQPSLHFS